MGTAFGLADKQASAVCRCHTGRTSACISSFDWRSWTASHPPLCRLHAAPRAEPVLQDPGQKPQCPEGAHCGGYHGGGGGGGQAPSRPLGRGGGRNAATLRREGERAGAQRSLALARGKSKAWMEGRKAIWWKRDIYPLKGTTISNYLVGRQEWVINTHGGRLIKNMDD